MSEKNFNHKKFSQELKKLSEKYDRDELAIRKEHNILYEGKGTHPLLLKLYREYKQNVKTLMEECQ